jgi:hypothetical protein
MLCGLAGRYDIPMEAMPTRFLAPHRLFKNSAQGRRKIHVRLYVYVYCTVDLGLMTKMKPLWVNSHEKKSCDVINSEKEETRRENK